MGFEGGHGDLGEDDGVDIGGEFFDFIEEHVVVFFGMAGLEHLEGFGAESGFDFDGSAGFVGGDLEQPSGGGKGGGDGGEEADAFAGEDGEIHHGPVDLEHGGFDKGAGVFDGAVEGGAGEEDEVYAVVLLGKGGLDELEEVFLGDGAGFAGEVGALDGVVDEVDDFDAGEDFIDVFLHGAGADEGGVDDAEFTAGEWFWHGGFSNGPLRNVVIL